MRAALLAFASFAAACAPSSAQVKPVPLAPSVLPAPPAGTSATEVHLFDAMMAIVRAQQSNPQAAQTASFAYVKALQQYHIGDLTGADASAVRALGIASAAAVIPLAVAPVQPMTLGTPPRAPLSLAGASPASIDADAFLALARSELATCPAGARAAASADYARAATAFTASNFEATRRAAKAVIDRCASAGD
jgi:hypothetical protein